MPLSVNSCHCFLPSSLSLLCSGGEGRGHKCGLCDCWRVQAGWSTEQESRVIRLVLCSEQTLGPDTTPLGARPRTRQCAVTSNQTLTIIHLGYVIRGGSLLFLLWGSAGGWMVEGTRYSVPRVCWAEPERCPWPGPGQGSRRLVGHQLHWSHTVATSSWAERVSIRGQQGAAGGLGGLLTLS